MDKKVLIYVCIVIAVFFGGYLLRGYLYRGTVSQLETAIRESQDAIREYQDDISEVTARLGAREKALEAERGRNTEHIKDIERLQSQLAESERRNREITDGIGTVQEGLGGIAIKANDGSGLIDGVLKIFAEAENN